MADFNGPRNSAKPIPFLQPKRHTPIDFSGTGIGNPVSYNQRAFEERTRWTKERQEKKVQVPLIMEPRQSLPLQQRNVAPTSELAQIETTATTVEGIATLSKNIGCGLGIQHVVFAKGQATPFSHVSNLGSGALSIVEEVQSTKTGAFFVRKTVNVSSGRASWLLPLIQKEVDVLKRLSHSHIITIQGTYQLPRNFCIIMSPVGDGNLAELLEDIAEHGFLLEQRLMIWHWLPCLTSALIYIHSQGVRHRDIKPANIIHVGAQVFMTDFGSCREFDLDATSSTNTADFGNTRLYSAPEVLAEDAKRGRPADVFSLGCVFLEMYSVARKRSAVDFYRFRERMGDGNPAFGVVTQEVLLEWTGGIATASDIPGLAGEAPFLMRMVGKDPDERPEADEVGLSLRARPCVHDSARVYDTVYWPTAMGDSAGGEEKVVY